MTVIGLDGFRSGWVGVSLDDSAHDIKFFKSIEEVLDHPFSVAMIDIPIGLPESGTRLCDREARTLLGRDRNRVFLGARRPLLRFGAHEYDSANSWGKSVGAGVSKQLFCLLPKIAEVDAVMNEPLQQRIRETHPELVFFRLNDWQPLPSKKTKEGGMTRRHLIREQGISQIDKWLDEIRIGTGAKADDVLDACAAAIAAREPQKRLPEAMTEVDSRGLKMEIWF